MMRFWFAVIMPLIAFLLICYGAMAQDDLINGQGRSNERAFMLFAPAASVVLLISAILTVLEFRDRGSKSGMVFTLVALNGFFVLWMTTLWFDYAFGSNH